MSLINRIQLFLWRQYLPWLQRNGAEKGTPHDYYSVFIQDTTNTRYRYKTLQDDQNTLVLSVLLQETEVINCVKRRIKGNG
ncbi:hypothetical protein [Silvania hatchlandensis]|uniref:Uncharacterized protein n=1 Tax=Silvania hatchlandensis TaxID=2926469 RepID=A0A9J6Q519_9ENTR|nr:hypothetical protein [Silvania hatchlandensis]MCU6666784.1 hypothetical protein [Silvania hatchlandensis]